MTMMMLMQTTS